MVESPRSDSSLAPPSPRGLRPNCSHRPILAEFLRSGQFSDSNPRAQTQWLWPRAVGHTCLTPFKLGLSVSYINIYNYIHLPRLSPSSISDTSSRISPCPSLVLSLIVAFALQAPSPSLDLDLKAKRLPRGLELAAHCTAYWRLTMASSQTPISCGLYLGMAVVASSCLIEHDTRVRLPPTSRCFSDSVSLMLDASPSCRYVCAAHTAAIRR